MFDGFWYRCEVKHYSIADEWGDHSYTSTEVVWSKFAVIKTTPKGVWLQSCPWSTSNPDYALCRVGEYHMGDVFVLGTSRKQLACPTKELALADAIARKKSHIWGCQARLQAAQKDLQELEFEHLKLRPQSTKDAA